MITSQNLTLLKSNKKQRKTIENTKKQQEAMKTIKKATPKKFRLLRSFFFFAKIGTSKVQMIWHTYGKPTTTPVGWGWGGGLGSVEERASQVMSGQVRSEYVLGYVGKGGHVRSGYFRLGSEIRLHVEK
jgi:hypothetical protein